MSPEQRLYSNLWKVLGSEEEHLIYSSLSSPGNSTSSSICFVGR